MVRTLPLDSRLVSYVDLQLYSSKRKIRLRWLPRPTRQQQHTPLMLYSHGSIKAFISTHLPSPIHATSYSCTWRDMRRKPATTNLNIRSRVAVMVAVACQCGACVHACIGCRATQVCLKPVITMVITPHTVYTRHTTRVERHYTC